MKKNNNRTRKKLKYTLLAVTAEILESSLLQKIIEKLAQRRPDTGHSDMPMPEGWKAVETSTIEAHVNGDLVCMNKRSISSVEFSSVFMFTCSKAQGEKYNFCWVNSLN